MPVCLVGCLSRAPPTPSLSARPPACLLKSCKTHLCSLSVLLRCISSLLLALLPHRSVELNLSLHLCLSQLLSVHSSTQAAAKNNGSDP